MAEKKVKELIREAGLGPRIDVKTRWNEGMVGVKVNEGNNIALVSETQKERLTEMLEQNQLEELWAEADGFDAENRLPERAIGLDNLMGDEDEDMGKLVGDNSQDDDEIVPETSTTRRGRQFLDPALKQNTCWDAAGGWIADGYVVTQIPGVNCAIRSKDQVEEPQDFVWSQELLQAPFWKAVTDKELGGLREKLTYDVVDLPKDRKAIPSNLKIVFTVKSDACGQISKYKSRVVVQGFRQRK
eukprot:1750996-Rhodomonas_salina.2